MQPGKRQETMEAVLSKQSAGTISNRAVVVSSMYTDQEMAEQIGREAYSYRFVYRAFAPLLGRWGQISEVTRPESRLDFALWRARQQNLEPIHLSFLPLHLTYLTGRAPNVAYPFWEFPDIPNTNFANNSRNNWVHIANHLALLLTASTFTRDAFVRAGVKTPVQVVPVPIAREYFSVPVWEEEQHVTINCPAYLFPLPEPTPGPAPNPWAAAPITDLSLKARVRYVYKCYVKPRVPARLDKYVTVALRTIASVRQARAEDVHIAYPVSPTLDLSGVVYTTILNPFDPRKNWQDLLSAYLLALGDREDATLVLKLIVCPKLAPAALNGMVQYYHGLGIRHRCKVAFITHYLSDAQMVELTRASTYYINSARAEGACLPLQSFLAARRPGIAPIHTALADYFQKEIGFPIASHPEPACWPHDPEQRLTTRWNRIVWQSLYEQLQTSYQVAKQDCWHYQELALNGRECMADYAGAERIWPLLSAALDLATEASGKPSSTWAGEPVPVRKAS